MYCFCVLVFTLTMIYAVAPNYGRSHPLVYISICSLVGSVSIMAIKGFGIAVKLTFAGNNQFIYVSTYVFGIVVSLCIMVQMNYFNKALDTFSTNVYVCHFTSLLCHPSLTPLTHQSEPSVLRLLLNGHHHRLPHPLPRPEHGQPCEHSLPPRRVYHHLHRDAPPRALTQASSNRPHRARARVPQPAPVLPRQPRLTRRRQLALRSSACLARAKLWPRAPE